MEYSKTNGTGTENLTITSSGTGFPVASYGAGYITTDETIRRLVGRTLSFIEAIGLPDKQEVSVKEHVKNLIYGELCETYFWVNSVIATEAIDKMRALNIPPAGNTVA